MAQAKSGLGRKVKIAVGVGAALAAAATAAYLLTGERGKKNRSQIKKLTKEMQTQVAAELKQLKKTGKKEYHAILEKVAKLKK